MVDVRVSEAQEHPESAMLLRNLLHRVAIAMLGRALDAEVEAYLACHREARDERGRAQVVRNGRSRLRRLATPAGIVEIRAPRVHDRRVGENGERYRFASRILPVYVRRVPKLVELLPPLYLAGLATGDFAEARRTLAGGSDSGPLSSTVTRLTESWHADHRMWQARRLVDADYVYVWVGSVPGPGGADERASTLLLVIGVRLDGAIELAAVDRGARESTESWAKLLGDASRRGMPAPVVAVGHGTLGFWDAAATVWSEVREPHPGWDRLSIVSKLPQWLQANVA